MSKWQKKYRAILIWLTSQTLQVWTLHNSIFCSSDYSTVSQKDQSKQEPVNFQVGCVEEGVNSFPSQITAKKPSNLTSIASLLVPVQLSLIKHWPTSILQSELKTTQKNHLWGFALRHTVQTSPQRLFCRLTVSCVEMEYLWIYIFPIIRHWDKQTVYTLELWTVFLNTGFRDPHIKIIQKWDLTVTGGVAQW